jgi:hypothetical protein
MKTYQLAPDEVIRHQSQVTLQTEKGEMTAEMILTNLNFIFITPKKKFLWFKQKYRYDVFAKEVVKTFKEVPDITQTDATVKICFTTEDRIVVFGDKKEARTFVINAWEIITGKTAFERHLDKLKKALDYVDDTLGFDIRDVIKEALTSGVKEMAVGAVLSTAKKLLPKKKTEK